MNKKALYSSALVLAMAVSGLAGAATPEDKTRVVYHVNQGEPGLHKAAVRNVQNHINAVGAENMDIKLVMHGGGINLLLAANDHPDIQAAVDSLKLQGVDFQVCRNTLSARQLPMEALYDTTEADIVPSGVAQLSILQREGYTYIKP
ncbi:DsrE family protein [Thioalkalivibrio sp.]|uniref:DsrE family protein n=1 Tax=Thioalkalivibrio sp. TaxID=2093813 RepID=UPI0039756FD5